MRGLTAPEIENLVAAAEHWVGGPERDLVSELAAAGEPPEVIEAARQRASHQPQAHICWVLPVNWPAVQLLLALETQWDRAGLAGVRVGLKYDRIEPVLRARPDIDQPWPDLFHRLQILERAALAAMSERAHE